MALYRTTNRRPLSTITPAERISNQYVLSGTNPEFVLDTDGFVLLEMLTVETGTVTIADGKNVTMATGVGSFNKDIAPISCENGVKFTGDVGIAVISVFRDKM